MNCDSYERMLFLYRDGELTNREAEELVRHLHSCERCRMEQERIARNAATIRNLRSWTPTTTNPALLTSRIVEEIRSARSDVPVPRFLDTVLDFFVLPHVRIAAIAAILLVVGTFLVQYLTLFADIRSLEVYAHQSVKQSDATEVLYSVESRKAVELMHDADARGLLPPDRYSVSSDQIVVQRSDVLSLLSSYRLRSITFGLASSALHLDRRTLESLTNDIIENTTIITRFKK